MTTDITTVDAQGNYDVSKLNAVRHGILSRHAILPWEEKSEYEALIAALEDEYEPQGITEWHLVEELGGVIWRKSRLRGAEKAIYMQRLNSELKSTSLGHSPIGIVLMNFSKDQTETKDAIVAAPEQTEEDLQHARAALTASKRALAIVRQKADNAYQQALEALGDGDREVWPEWIGEPESDYSSPKYQANAESLEKWIKKNIEYYERVVCELENRPAIREQTIGQSFPNADNIDKLSRYEVHLDRKFERTLSMLVKLQDMHKTSVAATAH